MSIERTLVQHLRGSSFENLSPNAVEAARREVLWNLGTSVAGAAATGSEKLIAYVRSQGGHAQATVLGFGDRVPAVLAGFANGCFAKALEYEDKLWLDTSHGFAIGTSVVPAAFATAERIGGVDGRRFLAAVAVATDIQARLLRVVADPISSGWNVSYLYAAFGAALVAGKLLDLTEDQLFDALGLTYAQIAGNRQSILEAVTANRVQMGLAVRNGLAAVDLATFGIDGPRQFLTGEYGLFPHFFKGARADLNSLTEGLGSRWEGVRLGFKAYPVGAVVHPVLDAVLALAARADTSPENIDAIQVFGTRRLRIMVEPTELRQQPRTPVEAQFSLPWAVACVLVDQRLSFAHFTADALRDPRYVGLAQKVTTDMSGQDEGVSVELRFHDGRTARSDTVYAARGHPDKPLSTDDIIETYRECVQLGPSRLPAQRTQAALDRVLGMEDVADVGEIVRLLGA